MNYNQHIADLGFLFEQLGIQHVIICPGSQNAPLIQLFTSNESFTCHSIVDERSAAYVALGMARQIRQPVVVVTTSGTAVLNLAPAVAEAHYQHVPLIVLTADRPLEKISQFNNQIIDQVEPYVNNSKGFFELPVEVRDQQELGEVLSIVEELVKTAVTLPGGPVHLNIPLAEPFYEKLPGPLLHHAGSGIQLASAQQDSVASDPVPSDRKILILAGTSAPDEEIQWILTNLANSRQVVVVAENIANMPSDDFIANPELLLAGTDEDERKDLAPDLVVSFGGQVVSKQLKLFLQALENLEVWMLEGSPAEELNRLTGKNAPAAPATINQYLKAWKKAEARVRKTAVRFLDQATYCNLTAIQRVIASIPERSVLHLGNSSTIRYSQLLPLRQDLSYFSNRGTSGIDGCVSAAVGAALVSSDLHVLVVGDLSFVYDSNALWNRNYPKNLKIIVMNDGGGGIFRLLEGPDRMDFFEEYSVTHHPVSLELLTQSFGRIFQRARSMEELEEKLEVLFQPDSSISVLEVETSASENSRTFKDFMKLNQ
ncbi:MAG: 2-succinyl-5-enolpyruvyl-6-hydroxy-3-cyclohexene-1-carboxylic-acid synthase [Bacteroidales bacterium]|nr:2-succinyl-5-enolpyruvyl-6-hydroxy-3-cyclohexene-1-carboxylic-acid synthase [Bacteroidales bacterium]